MTQHVRHLIRYYSPVIPPLSRFPQRPLTGSAVEVLGDIDETELFASNPNSDPSISKGYANHVQVYNFSVNLLPKFSQTIGEFEQVPSHFQSALFLPLEALPNFKAISCQISNLQMATGNLHSD